MAVARRAARGLAARSKSTGSPLSQVLGRRAHVSPELPPALRGDGYVALDTDVGTFWMPASDGVMRPYLQRCGTWERPTADVLRRFIRPGYRFLDVGAGFGFFSVLVAQAAERVQVDAVEPLPGMLELLRFNLWLNRAQARVWPCALAERRAGLPLKTAASNLGDTRLQDTNTTGASSLIVPTITGDELFSDRSFDLIKVDVQGWELEVLTGMQRVLSQSPQVALIVEFWPSALRQRDKDPGAVLDGYRAMGFKAVVLRDAALEEMPARGIIALCDSAGPEGSVNLLLRH